MVVFQRAVVIAFMALCVKVEPILVHHFINGNVLRITNVNHSGRPVAFIQLDDKRISLLFYCNHDTNDAHQHQETPHDFGGCPTGSSLFFLQRHTLDGPIQSLAVGISGFVHSFFCS